MAMASSDDIYKNATATSMLCMPYIVGVRLQIERYLNAQSRLKLDPINAGYLCLHEISSLFESLDMLRRYLKSMDLSLWDEKLKIQLIRDSIRHDTRYEVDSKNNNKRRAKRQSSIGTNPELIFNILFHDDGVTVGGTRIYFKEIYHYVNSAERVVTAAS